MIDFAAELKQQIDIIDVARRLGIEIERKSGVVIGWPCPTDHGSTSKTPFHILPDVQGCRCHSCGFSGDVFSLVGQARFGDKGAFRKAMEWLCDEYQIDPPGRDWTPEQKKAYRKKREEAGRIHALLTEACAYWHQSAPDELFAVLEGNWGISRETAEDLQIGYASGQGLLRHLTEQGFSGEELKASGLFNGKNGQFEHFKKRIIFPYWHYGDVVYLIARRVEEKIGAPPALCTEDSEYEQSKYKKLRVHSEKNSHISQAIKNDYLYGGSNPPGDQVLITEGVTDCIAANQAGIPCISPVTVRFKKSEHEALLEKCKGYKRVYVCNDNEATGAGEGGALDTLRYLAGQGVNAYMIALPLPKGKEKIDLCEFLRDSGSGAFKELMSQADHAVEATAKRIDKALPEMERIYACEEALAWVAKLDKAGQKFHLGQLKKILDTNVPLLREYLKGIQAEQRVEQAKRIKLSPKDSSWENDLSWRYDRDGTPHVKSVAVNAVKILLHDERWEGVLAYDNFQHRPVYLKPPPFPEDYALEEWSEGQPLEDRDYLRVGYWLSEEWELTLKQDGISGAVYTVAGKNTFHPIRQYLDGLTWDSRPRLDSWLGTYLGANGDEGELEYLRLVGKLWMISAVARIYEPGCKADNVLILEGGQGKGKSTALEILAGEFFTDTPLDLGSKDSYLAIQGAWIVEMAELDALMRAESSSAKAFFTSKSDKYRPPYGRETVSMMRQCVFAGSVNHNDYLKDRTGGRRYWPVLCHAINLDALRQDRDLLWAEAVALYNRGERWWPEGDEQRKLCEKEQALRQMDDPWEDLVSLWLIGRNEATVAGILEGAISMPAEKWTRRHETRVGQLMVKSGWQRRRRQVDGKKTTVYLRPEE